MVYTSYERSINARKQLRDRKGRWIDMGGSIRAFLSGKWSTGKVSGIEGDYVWFVDSNGNQRRAHRSSVESIREKARLGARKAVQETITEGPVEQIRNTDEWTKVGPQQGSNPGGFYRDPETGEQAYFKFISEDKIKNEVLANRLYSLAGVASPGAEMVSHQGRFALYSPLVPGDSPTLAELSGDEDFRKKIQDGFAVDAWVGNWDVIGLVRDNVVADDDGNPIRIDAGGALRYRAMGTPKGSAWNDEASEWTSMRSSNQGAPVFGDMTDDELRESAAALQSITDDDIDTVVDSVGYDEALSAELKATLKTRRDNILERAGLSKAGDDDGLDSGAEGAGSGEAGGESGGSDSDGPGNDPSVGSVALSPHGRENELSVTPDIFETTDAEAFHAGISRIKESPVGAAVHVYDPEEYRDMRLFMNESGTAGFALKDGDEIVSVFSTPENPDKGIDPHLLAHAVAQGGSRLDAFDTVLPKIYARAGFKPVARLEWNDDYAPDDWPYDSLGRPDVVFMQYDPSRIGSTYDPNEGEYVQDYDDGVAAAKGALERTPAPAPEEQETAPPANPLDAFPDVVQRSPEALPGEAYPPTDEQQKIIDAVLGGLNTKAAALAGSGKALRWDQPVATPTGFRPIGDLVVGDPVLGTDGKTYHVTGVYPQGVRPLYNVQINKGTVIVADGDHLWNVQHHTKRAQKSIDYETVTTEELLKRGLRGQGRHNWFLPPVYPTTGEPTDLPLDPYILGCLLGDGSIGGGSSVQISTADVEILDTFSSYLNPRGVSLTHNGAYDYRLTVTPGSRKLLGRSYNPIINDLRVLGLWGTRSHTKFVPPQYLYATYDQRLDMLRGLVDTDGHVPGDSIVDFTSSSPQLANDFSWLCLSVGATVYTSVKETTHKDAHRVRAKFPRGVVPARLHRKARHFIGKQQRDVFRAITSITPTAPDAAVCISVDSPDNLFLTTGFTPTHNTSTVLALAKRLELEKPELQATYLVFNKANADEAKAKLPGNIEPMTMHALAYASTPAWMKKRLRDKQSALHTPKDIAEHFEVPQGGVGGLSRRNLVRAAQDAVRKFSQSGDDEILDKHVRHPGEDDGASYPQSQIDAIKELAGRFWADKNTPKGVLSVEHDDYRKRWALADPDLTAGNAGNKAAQLLIVDEAQDLPPVVSDIISKNQARGMQILLVGDSNQAINGFAGSEDFIGEWDADVSLPLTKSWRFGENVADIGNRFLQLLDADQRVVGGSSTPGEIGPIDAPDAILTRTNAGLLREVQDQQAAGRVVGVPKGTKKDLKSLASSARWLRSGGYKPSVVHDDILPFDSWEDLEVEALKGNAVASKIQGIFGELDYYEFNDLMKSIDDLVEDGDSPQAAPVGGLGAYNIDVNTSGDTVSLSGKDTYMLNEKLKSMSSSGKGFTSYGFKWTPSSKSWVGTQDGLDRLSADLGGGSEAQPLEVDVVVSTAHKSKGLEWDSVKISDDFRVPTLNEDTGELEMPDDDEHRLAYVAVTRAQKALDPGSLGYVFDYTDKDGGNPRSRTQDVNDSERESDELASPAFPDRDPLENDHSIPAEREKDERVPPLTPEEASEAEESINSSDEESETGDAPSPDDEEQPDVSTTSSESETRTPEPPETNAVEETGDESESEPDNGPGSSPDGQVPGDESEPSAGRPGSVFEGEGPLERTPTPENQGEPVPPHPRVAEMASYGFPTPELFETTDPDNPNKRLFRTADGEAGFDLEGSELSNLFSSTNHENVGRHLVATAVNQGADRVAVVDDEYLPFVLAPEGFFAVAAIKDNTGYNTSTFMAHDPDRLHTTYDPNSGTGVASVDEGRRALREYFGEAEPASPAPSEPDAERERSTPSNALEDFTKDSLPGMSREELTDLVESVPVNDSINYYSSGVETTLIKTTDGDWIKDQSFIDGTYHSERLSTAQTVDDILSEGAASDELYYSRNYFDTQETEPAAPESDPEPTTYTLSNGDVISPGDAIFRRRGDGSTELGRVLAIAPDGKVRVQQTNPITGETSEHDWDLHGGLPGDFFKSEGLSKFDNKADRPLDGMTGLEANQVLRNQRLGQKITLEDPDLQDGFSRVMVRRRKYPNKRFWTEYIFQGDKEYTVVPGGGSLTDDQVFDRLLNHEGSYTFNDPLDYYPESTIFTGLSQDEIRDLLDQLSRVDILDSPTIFNFGKGYWVKQSDGSWKELSEAAPTISSDDLSEIISNSLGKMVKGVFDGPARKVPYVGEDSVTAPDPEVPVPSAPPAPKALQLTSDKQGRPLAVGDVVLSKLGVIGRVESYDAAYDKLKVTTPTGDIKFWKPYLVEKKDQSDFVPESSAPTSKGVKTDDSGKQYVLDGQGNATYIGDSVSSKGKKGISGTVTKFSKDGTSVYIDTGDGKPLARKTNVVTKDTSAPAPDPGPDPSEGIDGSDVGTTSNPFLDAHPDDIFDVLESFKPGTKIRITDPKTALELNLRKNDSGQWIEMDSGHYTEVLPVVVVENLTLSDTNVDVETASGSGDTKPTVDNFMESVESIKAQEVGTVYSDEDRGFRYVKTDQNRWSIYDIDSGDTPEATNVSDQNISTYFQDRSKYLTKSTAPNELLGANVLGILSDASEGDQVTVGNTTYTKLPELNLWERNSDSGLSYVSTYNLKNLIENASPLSTVRKSSSGGATASDDSSVVDEPLKPAVPRLVSKDLRNIEVGDTVRHPTKHFSGTVSEVFPDTGEVQVTSPSGDRRTYKASSLNILAAQGKTRGPVNEESEWFGKDEPSPYVPTIFQVPEAWSAWADEFYDYFKKVIGADLLGTSAYDHVEPLLKMANNSWPPNAKPYIGYKSDDAFDFLYSRGYISPDLVDVGRELWDKFGKAGEEHAAREKAAREKYRSDYADWLTANGHNVSFTPKHFTLDDANLSGAMKWGQDGNKVATRWGIENLDVDADRFTPSELSAVSSYSSSGYLDVSTALRRGEKMDSYSQEIYDGMMSAIEKSAPAPEAFMVSRGTTSMSLTNPSDPEDTLTTSDLQDLVGKVLVDRGFMSTSIGDGPPAFVGKPLWLKIKVPAGLKTAWLGSMTSGLQSENPTEREVVLPPNTRLYIHKVELDADSGGYGKRTIVTAEVVPEDWEPPASSRDYAGVTPGPTG